MTKDVTIIQTEKPTSLRHESVILDFDPKEDGFGFTNVFTWTGEDLDYLSNELTPMLKAGLFLLPVFLGKAIAGRKGGIVGIGLGVFLTGGRLVDTALRSVSMQWPTFGLCGGMALRAKQRWVGDYEQKTCALNREEMRSDLRIAQEEALRASWTNFLRYWILARARSLLGQPMVAEHGVLAAELQQVTSELRDGRPCIVGLVGDTPDPFATHQVVVFGIELEPDCSTLHVYDPNAPGRTRHVWIHSTPQGVKLTTDLPTGPKKAGGYHISKKAGDLSMLFAINV